MGANNIRRFTCHVFLPWFERSLNPKFFLLWGRKFCLCVLVMPCQLNWGNVRFHLSLFHFLSPLSYASFLARNSRMTIARGYLWAWVTHVTRHESSRKTHAHGRGREITCEFHRMSLFSLQNVIQNYSGANHNRRQSSSLPNIFWHQSHWQCMGFRVFVSFPLFPIHRLFLLTPLGGRRRERKKKKERERGKKRERNSLE